MVLQHVHQGRFQYYVTVRNSLGLQMTHVSVVKCAFATVFVNAFVRATAIDDVCLQIYFFAALTLPCYRTKRITDNEDDKKDGDIVNRLIDIFHPHITS